MASRSLRYAYYDPKAPYDPGPYNLSDLICQSSLLSFMLLLQPHCSPLSGSNKSGMLLPQGLCTFFFFLECCFPNMHLDGSFPSPKVTSLLKSDPARLFKIETFLDWFAYITLILMTSAVLLV